MDELYKHDRYENRNLLYLFNKDIVEYDIKSANLSIAKEFKLLPDSKIKWLEGFSKERRVREDGLIKKKDPKYAEAAQEAFAECRRLFIENNNLERDDIISIRKDAIWTTKTCRFTEFGKHIKFVDKEHYSSFIRLDKRIEIFYSPMKIKVSGIDSEKVKLHDAYMMRFISRWFQKMETDTAEDVIDYTRRFIDRYKSKSLEVGYYRTFDKDSKIYLMNGEGYGDYWEDKKEDIDILYNYFNVLIKLIKIPI